MIFVTLAKNQSQILNKLQYLNMRQERWRLYIFPVMHRGRSSLRKRMDVFWKIDLRQEVDLFILLKFLIIKWTCVIFI